MHVHYYRGQWDEAVEVARRAASDLEQRQSTICVPIIRSYETLISVARGDLDRAKALEAELRTPIAGIEGLVALARSWVHRSLGDSAQARALIAAFLGGGPRPDVEAAVLIEELVDIALENGDVAGATALAAEIASAEDLSLTETVRLRARAVADGDAGAARAAVESCRAIGMPFELARAQLALANLRVDPHENLLAAHTAFSTLGAVGWKRRTAKAMRAEGLTIPRARPAADAGALVGVDAELARLLAHGMSNAQIASALHYSRKTVEVYLSRIYSRTGCRSRMDLVRAIDAGRVQLGD